MLEKCAGAIVYKIIDNRYYFLLVHTVFDHIAFSKGHIEGNEDKLTCALREVKEETNLDIKIDDSFIKTITYPLYNGNTKEVTYFLATCVNENIKVQENEIKEANFYSFDEAMKKLSYKKNQSVLLAAMTHLLVKNANRIAIIGCPGSGKTYLSRYVAQATNLAKYHLDNYFYYGEWQQVLKETFARKVNKLVKNEKWIIDGNYTWTLKSRLARADYVIYLKPRVSTCKKSVYERIEKKEVREDLPPLCIETHEKRFMKYIDRFKKTYEFKINAELKKAKGNIMTFSSRKLIDEFIRCLKKESV